MTHIFFLLIALHAGHAQALECSGTSGYEELSSDEEESADKHLLPDAYYTFTSRKKGTCIHQVINHKLWLPEMFNLLEQSRIFAEGSYKTLYLLNIASYVGILFEQEPRDTIAGYLQEHPLSSNEITERIISLLLPSNTTINHMHHDEENQEINTLDAPSSAHPESTVVSLSSQNKIHEAKIQSLVGSEWPQSQERIKTIFSDARCDLSILQIMLNEGKCFCPDMFNILEKKQTAKKKNVSQKTIISMAKSVQAKLSYEALASIIEHLKANQLRTPGLSDKICKILAQKPIHAQKRKQCASDLTMQQIVKVQSITPNNNEHAAYEYEDDISALLMGPDKRHKRAYLSDE